MVAYSDELAPGDVTALRYWSTELVLWCDESGDFHLQDAFCPHLGAHLGAGLNELQKKHPCLGLVSGRGLMWAIELVRNKETREPFVGVDRYSIYAKTADTAASQIVGGVCFEEGVAIGAFLPNSIRLATAFVATKADIDFGLRALDKGLSELDKYCD